MGQSRIGSQPGIGSQSEISVIIPTFNRARFLPETIRSVLEQSVPVQEILVVDDGSRDDTAAVAAGLPGPIRYLHQENAGPAAARNHGLREARGSLVALLDSDDLWLPGKLEHQLEILNARPEVGLVHTAAAIMDEAGTPTGEVWGKPEYVGASSQRLLIANGINASSVLARRAVLVDAGGWDERLRCLENWETWIRVSRLCALAYLETPFIRYRWHSGNLIKDLERQRVAYRLLLHKHLELSEPVPPLAVRREVYARFYRAFADAQVGKGDYAGAQRDFLLSLFFEPIQPQVWWRLLRTTQARILTRPGGRADPAHTER